MPFEPSAVDEDIAFYLFYTNLIAATSMICSNSSSLINTPFFVLRPFSTRNFATNYMRVRPPAQSTGSMEGRSP